MLGAGDAFMAGFLRGWLRDEPIERCCDYRQCVRRDRGVAPRLRAGDAELGRTRSCSCRATDWPHRLRESAALEQLHWSTNRTPRPDALTVLAIDHRSQFDDLVADLSARRRRAGAARSRRWRSQALDRVAGGDPAFGTLLDGRYGARALEAAADLPYWIGRPIEVPGSRPIAFEGSPDVAATLRDWPAEPRRQMPGVLPSRRRRRIARATGPPDPAAVRRVPRDPAMNSCSRSSRPSTARSTRDTIARVIDHVYDMGVYPDWWKLEPSDDAAAWAQIEATIARRDPHCRGVVLLGLAAPQDELLRGLRRHRGRATWSRVSRSAARSGTSRRGAG